MTENLYADMPASAFPGLSGKLGRDLTRRSGDETPKEMAAPHIAEGVFGKVPEVAIGFWIIKIAATTLGETGGDTLLHVAEPGICDKQHHFLCALCCCGGGADSGAEVSRVPVLGGDRGDDIDGDDHGGLFRSFAGDRVSRRVADPVCAGDYCSDNLAAEDGIDFSGVHHVAEGGDVLLDDDSVFEHAGNGAGRLGSGFGAGLRRRRADLCRYIGIVALIYFFIPSSFIFSIALSRFMLFLTVGGTVSSPPGQRSVT